MADVEWIGVQRRRAQVERITVTTADTAAAITVTVGNRAVAVTPTTTNITTTAAEIAAACEGSTEPEFEQIAWTTASGNVVFATGPDDGTPITVSTADAGGNVTAVSTLTAPLSPNHADDARNYLGNALPTAGDRLVLQNSAVSILHGLDAFDGVDVDILRKPTYTGAVGLLDENPEGYREYRRTHLQTDGASIVIEQAANDAPGQFRIEGTGAAAVTLSVTGSGQSGTRVGEEVVEVYGLPAASVVDVAGGSVAIAPSVGQTATVGTLLASDATVRIGPGVTLAAGQRLHNLLALIESSWSGTLTLDGQGTSVTVGGAAAGVFILDGGAMVWRSTGNPGNSPVIASGARLDLTLAPVTLTIGGTVAAHAGSEIDDGVGRGGNYSVNPVRCTLADITWRVPNNKTFAMSG